MYVSAKLGDEVSGMLQTILRKDSSKFRNKKELVLEEAYKAHGLRSISFRYFNAAGATPDAQIGEHHEPETHLIPNILKTCIKENGSGLKIFGNDFETNDGTCIRDYIHVEDLVDAHIRVMEALQPGDRRIYNLGIGKGHSVRQVLEAAKRVTGVDFPVEIGDRRAGDPPELYADASKIAQELGWRAQMTDIDTIVESAWGWFKAHPDGYGD